MKRSSMTESIARLIPLSLSRLSFSPFSLFFFLFPFLFPTSTKRRATRESSLARFSSPPVSLRAKLAADRVLGQEIKSNKADDIDDVMY